MRDVHMRADRLDSLDEEWTRLGRVLGEGFWPMQEPIQRESGEWLIAGLVVSEGVGGDYNPAGIAMSAPNDLTQWRLVVIPKGAPGRMWGESAILARGSEVLNIARYNRSSLALVARSVDGGDSWSPSILSAFPMADTKPYTGRLSSGEPYLVGAIGAEINNRRFPLSIGVGSPGGMGFERIYKIRDAEHEGPGESNPRASLAYPYSVEREGFLYVGYSNSGGRPGNQNSAELAILPVEALTRRP